jgi:hypothetical protein
MYTAQSLTQQNTSLDAGYGIEQGEVDHVNHLVRLIESSRGESPCSGDLIEHTDEYGTYHPKAHINAELDRLDRFSIYGCPHTPFVFLSVDNQSVHFSAGGGPEAFVDPSALVFLGKREKQFMLFRSFGATRPCSIYFSAEVNAWEYVAPNQKHPGYSTKDWNRQYICYCEKPADGSAYHYYGQNIAFRNTAEYCLWMRTYRAVKFPTEKNHCVLFLYRETEKLISREEWDALKLPVDTRFCNGVIFVKVAYDDDNHMITTYRYTNSGFPESERLSPYELAAGAALVAPSFECTPGKGCKNCEHKAKCHYDFRYRIA